VSSRPPRVGGPTRWVAALITVGGLLAFCSLADVTRSAWASGAVTNSGDSAATGSLAFTHTYAAGPSCSAGPGATSVGCAGTLASGSAPGSSSLTGTDAITNNGNVASGALTQSVTVSSCEPVSFANTANAANPLVDRYGTTFDQSGPFTGAGSVAFDGTTGYATSVSAETQPPGALSLGTFSGIGIWFKAASGISGPLFSFGASASNGSGNVDRTLYLNSSGQLTFVWNTSGSNSVGPTTTSGGYANGVWHFVYLTLGGVSLVLATIPQVTLYVDGTQQAQTPALNLTGFTTYSGFWHAGYAPTATTGLGTAYFGGSLSDFVVFDGSSFPIATTDPTSVGAFATFATNATEWWPLNDSGTTTFTGTLPIVGAGLGSTASAACKSLDLAWSFTSPSGNATSTASSLSAWVATSGTTSAVSAPGAGATQSATLTVSHDAGYNAYVAGLHLWAPMTSTISVTPGAHWGLTFAWTPSAATTIVPTT
jgi:hypothetical protein